MDFFCFNVFGIDAVVADVRLRQGDNLLAIAGVSQDFLVAIHRSVENHLADGGTCGTYGIADKNCAVCKRQNGVRASSCYSL